MAPVRWSGYPLGHPTPPQPCLHRDGRTALHWAVHHGHLPSVDALINAGASLHIQDKKRWAFWGGRHGRLVRSRWASAAAGARRAGARPRMRLPTHHAWVSQAKALMAANEEVRSLAVWAVVPAGVPFGTD